MAEYKSPGGIILPNGAPWDVKSDRVQQASIPRNITSVMAESKFRDFSSYLRAIKIPWVYSCVSLISSSFADSHWDLFDGKDAVEDPNNPVLQLFMNPNPHQSGFEFLELMAMYMELTGEVFISLEERDGHGRPHEMYLPNPARMRVLPDPDKYIKGYVYETGQYNPFSFAYSSGQFIPYDPDEIVHIKMPNPMDDYRGFGAIEAGEDLLNIVTAMQTNEYAYWSAGGRITGVLETTVKVSDEDFVKIKNEWQAFSRDTKNRYKTAILEQGLKYSPVAEGMKGIDSVGIDKNKRDTILALFGVPAPKLGIVENAQYKQEDADRVFWCSVAGTQITTFDGPKAIEEIALGDMVLTHRGRWRPVVSKMNRDYTGEMHKIEVYGLPDDLECTAEHPFYVLRSNGETQRVPAAFLNPGDQIIGPRLQGSEGRVFKVVEVSSKNGRARVMQEIEIDEGRAWLMGLYAAEGSSYTGSDNRGKAYARVGMACGSHEVDTLAEATIQLARLGSTWTQESKCAASTTVSGGAVAQRFLSGGGTGAFDKHIPTYILNGPEKLLKSFLRGYWGGDGYRDGAARLYGCSTVSKRLAHDVVVALARLGVSSDIRFHKGGPRSVMGQDSKASDSWTVKITGQEFVDRAAPILGEEPFVFLGDRNTRSLKRGVHNDYMTYAIKSISKESRTAHVYNFEVEEDHTYTSLYVCSGNSETMWPKFRRFEDGIQPLIDLFDSAWVWRFTRTNFEDDTTKLTNAKAMQGLYCYTSNDIRAYTGASELGDDGDVIWIPNNMIPVKIDHVSALADRDEQQAAAALHASQMPPPDGSGGGTQGPTQGPPGGLGPNHPAVASKPPTVRGRTGAAKPGATGTSPETAKALEMVRYQQQAAAKIVARNLRERGAKAIATPMGRIQIMDEKRMARNKLPGPPRTASGNSPVVAERLIRHRDQTQEALVKRFQPILRDGFRKQQRNVIKVIGKMPRNGNPSEAVEYLRKNWDSKPIRDALIAMRILGGHDGYEMGTKALPPRHAQVLRARKAAAESEAKTPAWPQTKAADDGGLSGDFGALTDAVDMGDGIFNQALMNPLLADEALDPMLALRLSGNGLDDRIDGIDSTTLEDLQQVIAEGVRRGYSPLQIANGVEDEKYDGIMGVFDAVSDYRAELISRTEAMSGYNWGSVAAYQDAGVKQVEALDGDYDLICSERNGKLFDLDPELLEPVDKDGQPVEDHPNGTLAWAPIEDPNINYLGEAPPSSTESSLFSYGLSGDMYGDNTADDMSFAGQTSATNWERKYSDDEARDNQGQWTSGGAGSATAEAPIRTKDVKEAIKLLQAGKRVELNQPREVSTLIKKLAKVAEKAAEKGKETKITNLCDVSVPGTNLMCADHMNILRSLMPQLTGTPKPGSPAMALVNAKGEADIKPGFVAHLASLGIKVTAEQEQASYLRSTQKELDGVKVAKFMAKLEKNGPMEIPTLISREGYIIDGHHHWAAQVALDIRSNADVDPLMNVQRIDLPILEALKVANEYAAAQGIGSRSMMKLLALISTKSLEFKYSDAEARDAMGKWTSGMDNLSAADAAHAVIEAAKISEPRVTGDMQAISGAHGGRMQGLDFRLKSEKSMTRKLTDKAPGKGMTPGQYAQKIGDALRYTMLFPSDTLASGTSAALSELALRGYKVSSDEVENYFRRGDDYNGLNTNVVSPEGQRLELQFHTPETFTMKEDVVHPFYEKFRAADTSPEERKAIFAHMTALADSIPMPQGIMAVGIPMSHRAP